MYLVSAPPTKLLIEFLWNFAQPADVHVGIPLLFKFRRGDNSTYVYFGDGCLQIDSNLYKFFEIHPMAI
jgi:hypothetical protein